MFRMVPRLRRRACKGGGAEDLLMYRPLELAKASNSCLVGPHTAAQTRTKHGRRNHITAILFPEFRQYFFFFGPRKLDVHRHEDREHDERDERRPLK